MEEQLKIIIYRIILLILLAATFTCIFNFSAQNGSQSSSISQKVAKIIIDILPSTKNLEEEQKNNLVEQSQKIIRKGAHFSIYMVVGILIMAFMCTYNVKQKTRIFVSICVGLLYAISDETHQYFIPGRQASPIDVGIDTCGVITGILIVLVIWTIVNKIKIKKSYNSLA